MNYILDVKIADQDLNRDSHLICLNCAAIMDNDKSCWVYYIFSARFRTHIKQTLYRIPRSAISFENGARECAVFCNLRESHENLMATMMMITMMMQRWVRIAQKLMQII
jgi:hypothetical protein